MKKRTHKLLSILLALAMVLGMLPTMSLTAFAEGGDTPITAVELTLGNYAVDTKAGDISVVITTPTVDFGDGASYLHEEDDEVRGSYFIGYSEGVYYYELKPETYLEEGKPYEIIIHIKPKAGFTLENLTEENTKLNGIEAYWVNYYDYDGSADLHFYLKPLGYTSVTAVGLTLDKYALDKKADDISVGITTPNVDLYDGDAYYQYDDKGRWESGSYGIFYINESDQLGEEDPLEAGKPYKIMIDVKPEAGCTLVGLTKENAKLNGIKAYSIYFYSDGATLYFDLAPLGSSHTHTYNDEWKSDADKHWHECSCGAKSEEAAHTLKWVVDKAATATEKGSKHEECEFCGYKRAAVEIPATGNTGSGSGGSGSSGSSSGGNTTPAKKPVQSVDTGDMGIALYAGMTILSLTGGAWVVNKKRKSK